MFNDPNHLYYPLLEDLINNHSKFKRFSWGGLWEAVGIVALCDVLGAVSYLYTEPTTATVITAICSAAGLIGVLVN